MTFVQAARCIEADYDNSDRSVIADARDLRLKFRAERGGLDVQKQNAAYYCN